MENILLSDIINVEDSNVAIRLMSTNQDGDNPVEEFKQSRKNIKDWLFWRWRYKYFKEGDIVIGLVKLTETDYALASVSKITKDLDVENGVSFEGEELAEYLKYIGRVIVHYQRKHEQCKIYLDEKDKELVVKEIVKYPLF